MPKDKKILNQLLLAKKMSDQEDYVAKYNLMNKLLKERPDEFYVDQDHPDYPGIVHAPTGFRMHLPRQATYGIEKKAEDNIQLVAIPGLPHGGMYVRKEEFPKFRKELNKYFPDIQIPESPSEIIGYNNLLPREEIDSIIQHEKNHAAINRRGGLSAFNQKTLRKIGDLLTSASPFIGAAAGVASGNVVTGLGAGVISAGLGRIPAFINENQARTFDGSKSDKEGYSAYKKHAILAALAAAGAGATGAILGNSANGLDVDKLLRIPGLEKRSSAFSPDLTAEEMQEAVDSIYDHKAPRLASMKAWPQEWLDDQDKMGWLEWYKNYSDGRRSDTDERQMKRWNSFKARHGSQFVKNPTPRRAYALRNWAIDPLELLPEDQRGPFQQLMEAYKAKEYKKWDKKKAKEEDNTLE